MKPLILRLEPPWHSSWLTPHKADLESAAVIIARSCNFHKTNLTGSESTYSPVGFNILAFSTSSLFPFCCSVTVFEMTYVI